MCGIAGLVGTATPSGDLVERMCGTLTHRGPDGSGLHVDERAALGMRRLAIVDVAGGQQPVYNEDRTVVAVFNGELYNFGELRAELVRRGHRLRSHGDAECLVHLYEEHGVELVHRLRGMFAFALWDARQGRLLLARDRVGKKPLYWREAGAGIGFASEAKALLAAPGFVPRVDPVALHHYLTYQYVPAPWSIYEGVHKLPPGHLLTWQGGVPEVRRYWRLDATPAPVADEAEAAERLRELLLDAVRARLVSERPLGAFLSGGVDSSAVVAAMAMQSAEPVQTFSVGFEDAAFDERRYARMVAERYGTDHHELVVTPSAADLLPDLAWHFDEPYADASAIPSYYLARFSRRHVTVVLNGDGGDECFGGYRRYALMQGMSRVPALPTGLLLRRLGAAVVARTRPRSPLRQVGRAVDLLGQPPARRYATIMSVFTHEEKLDLYPPDLRAQLSDMDSWQLSVAEYGCSRAADTVGRLIDVDVNTYLPGDLLAKVDVTTMANSLEARSPFLDTALMEWAARLPTRYKVRAGTTKYLLKRALEPWLPAAVLDRPKMGFGVPLGAWLRGELRDLAYDVLTDGTARGRGLLRPEAVAALLDRHMRGEDRSTQLWTLMQFELWHRRFLDSAARPAPVGGLAVPPA
ncbi:MAG TPA: asparagine synthase (glutamine-hydrolyzing) [Rugosimonospora sp.]|nr:asparagine synthase (glutamine-hydrolyzing) [Rugosimonospora sp.]